MGTLWGCGCAVRGFCDARRALASHVVFQKVRELLGIGSATRPAQQRDVPGGLDLGDGSQRACVAIMPASHAVRSEWSVGVAHAPGRR